MAAIDLEASRQRGSWVLGDRGVPVRPGRSARHNSSRSGLAREYAKDLRARPGLQFRALPNDAHAATLTTLLSTLRARKLDDRAARSTAISIASSALLTLRASASPGEQTVAAAFHASGEELRPLARDDSFELELAASGDMEALIAPEIAVGAQAVARGCVLVMLENTHPRRIRVSWDASADGLHVTIRDDGDGALFPEAVAVHRLRERLASFGGTFSVDAVAGWGTAVTARFPLAAAPRTPPKALPALSDVSSTCSGSSHSAVAIDRSPQISTSVSTRSSSTSPTSSRSSQCARAARRPPSPAKPDSEHRPPGLGARAGTADLPVTYRLAESRPARARRDSRA
jgi:hypothetical protein